jgi:hypothetical protein
MVERQSRISGDGMTIGGKGRMVGEDMGRVFSDAKTGGGVDTGKMLQEARKAAGIDRRIGMYIFMADTS